MSIAPEFKEFVDKGELIQIRSYLSNYLIVDQTFATFEEAFSYANSRLPVLQEHDNAPLELESSNWNKEYLNEQLVAVVSNFSMIRLNHIKDIIRVVLSKKAPVEALVSEPANQDRKPSRTGKTVIGEREVPNKASQTSPKESATHHRVQSTGSSSGQNRTGRRTVSETEKKSSSDEGKTEIGIDLGSAIIVGGAVVATVGIATVKPVVIGAGIAIVGVGIATKANNKRK